MLLEERRDPVQGGEAWGSCMGVKLRLAGTMGYGCRLHMLAMSAFKPKVPGQNDGMRRSVGRGGMRQPFGVTGERRGERESDC